MRTPAPRTGHRASRFIGKLLVSGLAGLLIGVAGCGGKDGDYYYLLELVGEGDTLVLNFVFTCGRLDITWNGTFAGQDPVRTELVIHHDNDGDACPESLRSVSFDLAPIKQAFHERFPVDQRLLLRIPPYDDAQWAMCLPDVFQTEPFQGVRCESAGAGPMRAADARTLD